MIIFTFSLTNFYRKICKLKENLIQAAYVLRMRIFFNASFNVGVEFTENPVFYISTLNKNMKF